MDSMEFVMGTSLETLPKTIDFNFEDLKAELGRSLSYYNGLVVTEGDIKSAKEDRAKLNKLREALENKRKDVKKECMAPYTDFETKVKELVGLIDKPILAIDTQLKGYEDQRRAAKRTEIEAIYEDTVGDLRTLLPFEKLWNDEWYNTGVSLKKIREAIAAAQDKTVSDLGVLSTVESEFAEAVKLKYLEALDLNAALAERARLQEQARRLREYEEQQARAKAAEAERLEKAAIHPAVAPCNTESTPAGREEIPQTPYGPDDHAEKHEPIYRLSFECQVTAAQAAELSAWLKAHNISYRRI